MTRGGFAICATALSLVQGSSAAYQCTSDVSLPVVKSSQKGLALDDTTFHWCPDQIPSFWPNTNETVASIRVFKAWESDWTEMDKHQAWQKLADFAKTSQAKVLLGTQISCNESQDDADWADVTELLKLLGPENVMGVAIGNEVDILWQNQGVTASCIQNMWQGGYFAKKFQSRVADMDKWDHFVEAQIPVTTVFSEYVLAGTPFVDIPDKAMANTFLTQMTKTYASRFVFTTNIYPYFDASNQYLTPANAIKRDTCFQDDSCLFSSVTKTFRSRIRQLTGGDAGLWIGETGWSSPAATTLGQPMKGWPDFSALPAFRATYENFLSWDMTLGADKGPDHVFYFTMRDAPAFGGLMEAFGLVGDELGDQHLCQEVKCKIQSTIAVLV